MTIASITESVEVKVSAFTDLLWNLTIINHTDPAMIGRRLVAERGRELVLGRDSEAFGPRALYNRRISRRQVTLYVDETDLFSLTDTESHNGTLVNGRLKSKATLSTGDVIEFGPVMLFVHRRPLAPSQPASEPAAGDVSWAMAQLRRAVDRVVGLPDSLWIVGERGVGKERLARSIHERSGRDPFIALDLTSFGSADARAQLFGEEGHPGILGSAEGGTLFLKRLDRAAPEVQVLLSAALDQCRSGAAGCRDVRVIATVGEAPSALGRRESLLPDLADRLGLLQLTVPPLREHLEDLPRYARAVLAEQGISDPEFDPSLVSALMRHPWPGNLRELEQVIRAASLTAGEHGKLVLTPELSDALGAPAHAIAIEVMSADEARMARDGSWAVVGRRHVDLATRPNLMRVFAALIARWESRRRSPMGPLELFEIGWPGETAAESSARARVYVAISTLRKMGLRRIIARQGTGYAIVDDDRIGVVDEAPGAST